MVDWVEGDLLTPENLNTLGPAGTVPATLDDLTDVTITAAASGEYLRFNGTAWVDVAASQILTDISEIPVANLADGTARQLLQTDAAGTGVEWTSNVDVPGTLDVTGAAVFDSTVSATQYTSTIATGTAPLVVASTTKVTNLNADALDDQSGAYYLDSANFTGTNWTDLTDGGTTTLHTHTSGIASSITLVDAAADTTTWVVLGTAQTGNVNPATDAGITYDASTNALTTTTFIGALTGNASTATALATARTIGGTSFDGTANIVPATITVADTVDASCNVALFESATGDLAPKTDAGLTYAADTGTLTATAFAGPLTGNVTGDVSGNAGTVTVAGEAVDTSCFLLFGTAASGSLSPKTHASLTLDSSTGITTLASAVLTTADINGGTLDASTIGATTPAAATVTALTTSGAVTIGGAAGADFNPGSDIDTDIVTVGVTGAPRLWWDESEDAFVATHSVILAVPTRDYKFTSRSAALAIQCMTTGAGSQLEWFNFDGDGTDDLEFTMYGVGTVASVTNRERLQFRYDASSLQFEITSNANGTGTLRPVVLYTGANTDQLNLGTGGQIGINQAASTTAALTLPAGTTGVASLRVPHGAAPTSPVNGDIWTTTAGLFVRVNGSTVGPLS